MRQRWLEAVLPGLGFAAAELAPLSARPAGVSPGAFLVTTTSGDLIKARSARSGSAAARAARWTGLLADPRVPQPLGVRGRLMLDAWVEGTPLTAPDLEPAVIERAADLLAAVHRFAGPGFPRLRSTAPISRRLDRQLDELVPAGLVDPHDARRLRGIVSAGLPAQALWGLTHGDYCGENLVLEPNGDLVAIDNANMTLGFLEYDLARSWYRWPRDARDVSRFEHRYDEQTGLGADRAQRPAWRATAAVKGLHVRFRHRWPPDRPLEAVAELVG